MGFQITPASLKKLCKELKLYSSAPELNDVLHLQCKGITKLENLDEYTGLKAIYLEQNAISAIENLDKLINLRCLYLGKNMITAINGLQHLTNIETLDLSDNYISTVKNLSTLPLLRTLNLSGNKLKTTADVEDLSRCPSLTSLDLASNRIDDNGVIEMLVGMPLLLLRLSGNPNVSSFKHYRKYILSKMPSLNYLDDSPCFPKDRRVACAFMEGGLDAERSMREQIKHEEEQLREHHLKAFDDMVQRARQAPPVPHDPMRFRAMPPGESDSDDEGLPPSYRNSNKRKAHTAASQSQPPVNEAFAHEAAVDVGAASSSAPAAAAAAAAGVPNGQPPSTAPEGADACCSGVTAAQEPFESQHDDPSTSRGAAALCGSAGINEPQHDATHAAAAQPSLSANHTDSELPSATRGLTGSSLQAASVDSTATAVGPSAESPACSSTPAAAPSTSRFFCQLSNLGPLAAGAAAAAGLVTSPLPLSKDGFKSELRDRAIARAAARAEAAAAAGSGSGARAGARSWVSPQLFGTANYRRLWDMAMQLGHRQEHEQQQQDAAESMGDDAAIVPTSTPATAAAAPANTGMPEVQQASSDASTMQLPSPPPSLLMFGPAMAVVGPAATAAPPSPASLPTLVPALHSLGVAIASGEVAADDSSSLPDSAMNWHEARLRALAASDRGDIDSARAHTEADLDSAAQVVGDEDLDSARLLQLEVDGDLDSAHSQQTFSGEASDGEGAQDLFERYSITTFGRQAAHDHQPRAPESHAHAAAASQRSLHHVAGPSDSYSHGSPPATAQPMHGTEDVLVDATRDDSVLAQHGMHAAHAQRHSHSREAHGRPDTSVESDVDSDGMLARYDPDNPDPHATPGHAEGGSQPVAVPHRLRSAEQALMRRADTALEAAPSTPSAAGSAEHRYMAAPAIPFGGQEHVPADMLGRAALAAHCSSGSSSSSTLAHDQANVGTSHSSPRAPSYSAHEFHRTGDVLTSPVRTISVGNDLLAQARAVVSSSPTGPSAGPSRHGSGIPDRYHQLAGTLHDPQTLAQARAAVLGGLSSGGASGGQLSLRPSLQRQDSAEEGGERPSRESPAAAAAAAASSQHPLERRTAELDVPSLLEASHTSAAARLSQGPGPAAEQLSWGSSSLSSAVQHSGTAAALPIDNAMSLASYSLYDLD